MQFTQNVVKGLRYPFLGRNLYYKVEFRNGETYVSCCVTRSQFDRHSSLAFRDQCVIILAQLRSILQKMLSTLLFTKPFENTGNRIKGFHLKRVKNVGIILREYPVYYGLVGGYSIHEEDASLGLSQPCSG